MSPKNSSDGYYTISFSKDNFQKTMRIHVLVAQYFVPNPNNYPEVNHKDFNRKNNRWDNLEWCTHQENIRYNSEAGRYKIRDFTGKNNPNYGNHILSDIYKSDPDLAKEKLARPAAQNGRAKKINLLDKDRKIIGTFDWVGGCAQFLIEQNIAKATSISYLRDKISRSIKQQTPYLDHYFEFA